MNKLGKGPNLTWIFIGIACAITCITLSMTSFDDFLSDNGVSVSDDFTNFQGNISAEQTAINAINSEATLTKNIVGVFGDVVSGTINVFVTGLSSIGAFFNMSKVVSSIFSSTKEAIPGLDALFGLLILIAGFYIAMAIIKARRGLSDTS